MNIRVNYEALKELSDVLFKIRECMYSDVQKDDNMAEKYMLSWESEAVGHYKNLQDFISIDIDAESTRLEYCAEELIEIIRERMEIDAASTLDV